MTCDEFRDTMHEQMSDTETETAGKLMEHLSRCTHCTMWLDRFCSKAHELNTTAPLGSNDDTS